MAENETLEGCCKNLQQDELDDIATPEELERWRRIDEYTDEIMQQWDEWLAEEIERERKYNLRR